MVWSEEGRTSLDLYSFIQDAVNPCSHRFFRLTPHHHGGFFMFVPHGHGKAKMFLTEEECELWLVMSFDVLTRRCMYSNTRYVVYNKWKAVFV